MFMKNITLRVIIFGIVSLFVGLPLAQAYPNMVGGNTQSEYQTAVTDRNNAYREEEKWETRYGEAKSIVDDLLGKWSGNEDAIKDGTWSLANTAAATLIAEIIRQTNNDNGKSNTDQMIEALPTILGIVNAVRDGIQLSTDRAERNDYLSALSTAVGALNEIISQNQAAFNTYAAKYDVYVELMQNHAGGLAREPNHSSSGNYSSVTAWSLATIKSTVKAADAYNATDSLNMLEFWYHVNDLKSTSQPSPHGFDRFNNFDDFWKLTPLPKSKRCDGDCGQQFQTPVEHLVVCPHALTVSSLQAGNTRLTGLPIDTPLPNGKVSPAGCDKAYYVCDSGDRNEHKVRICGKNNSNGNRCNEPYRNCNNSEYDHGGWLNSKHGKKAGNLITRPLYGFAPASGSSYTASAGDTHTGTVTASSIYGARLYVNSSLMGWFGGSTTATSLSLSYTFPSDASGDYTMMARVYPWSGDTYGNYTDYSYTVTIGSDNTTPTTAMAACNIHLASAPGNHTSTWLCNESPCSNRQVPYCFDQCPEAGNHGTATTPMHVCEVHELWQSGDHSWQTSCSDTAHNSNGDSCQASGFYECVSHTPVYPAATTVTAPVWSDIPDPYNLTVGDSFTLDLNSYVTGSPTITRNGGVIPAGLSFRNGIVSGIVSRVESRGFRFTATNAAGSTVSEWVNITVEAAQ